MHVSVHIHSRHLWAALHLADVQEEFVVTMGLELAAFATFASVKGEKSRLFCTGDEEEMKTEPERLGQAQ